MARRHGDKAQNYLGCRRDFPSGGSATAGRTGAVVAHEHRTRRTTDAGTGARSRDGGEFEQDADGQVGDVYEVAPVLVDAEEVGELPAGPFRRRADLA